MNTALVFICHAVWMKLSHQQKKVNLRFSNENAMTDFRKTWYVGSGGTSTTHVFCRHQMPIFNTSFAYLFWLANNKKVKYLEFCMSYIDETWYVGSDGHKYYPHGLSSQNAHI